MGIDWLTQIANHTRFSIFAHGFQCEIGYIFPIHYKDISVFVLCFCYRGVTYLL